MRDYSEGQVGGSSYCAKRLSFGFEQSILYILFTLKEMTWLN